VCCDLTRGCDANQQLTAGNEQLLGKQDSERSPDGTSDSAIELTLMFELIEIRVVAGPGSARSSSFESPEIRDKIPIRIKDTDGGHTSFRN